MTESRNFKTIFHRFKNGRMTLGGAVEKNNKQDNLKNDENGNVTGTYLLGENDVEIFLDNANNIIRHAQKMKMELVEPHEEEVRQVNEVVLQYIKDNKRKIYGGYALNYLLTNRDKRMAIYSDIDIPDIDFYSPDPIKDLIKICNSLHAKGYKQVSGREALHKETYSVRVNGQLYCDITYVPRNIYNKMPFREINGINVIGPEFMIIDYFRLITDILLTNWRLEKTVKRMYLLQKAYPLPYIKSPIEIPPLDIPKNEQLIVSNMMRQVQKFCENNNYAVLLGFYAYNQFLYASNILQSAEGKRFRYLEIPYYEIILTEYKTETNKLVNELKISFNDSANDIHVVEYYPFFQFFGHSAEIYYKKILLARLYTNNKKCVPYRKVKSHYFDNDTVKEGSKDILIGSFSLVTLYSLITAMKARVNDDNDTKKLYYAILSHINEFRKFYFKTMNKSLVDDTIFKEFVIECVGVLITPEHEKQLIIENRKKRNKKYTFSYDPAENIVDDINYVFANSSGNVINYIKNLKLSSEAESSDQDEDDFDSDDPNVVLK